jgi:hypothetical protein
VIPAAHSHAHTREPKRSEQKKQNEDTRIGKKRNIEGETRQYEHRIGGSVHDDRPYEPAEPIRTAPCPHELQTQAQTLLFLSDQIAEKQKERNHGRYVEPKAAIGANNIVPEHDMT